MNIINPKVLVLELLDIFSRLCIQFSEYMDAVEAKKKKRKAWSIKHLDHFSWIVYWILSQENCEGEPPTDSSLLLLMIFYRACPHSPEKLRS